MEVREKPRALRSFGETYLTEQPYGDIIRIHKGCHQ